MNALFSGSVFFGAFLSLLFYEVGLFCKKKWKCILRGVADFDAFPSGQFAEQIAHPKLCVNGKGNPAKCAPLTHNPGCARWYTSRSKA